MAMVMDQQQQAYKYYCRICKKGFGCGRALGGHMRAHGINDDHATDPDDDPSASGEWDDKLSPTAGGKRMYALRANPNRLKSCRVCENCGEDFRSWKSFLEHGRCRSDDEGDDSIPSSPRSDGGGCAGWSKGKRSRRAAAGKPSPSSEEEDLANCLVMLSSARVDPVVAVVETEESSASASKEEDRRYTIDRTAPAAASAAAEKGKAPAPAVPRGLFECKACKKVFSSHQALGGHRASHKKVKGCFAARLDDPDEPPPEVELMTHDDSEVVVAEMSMAIVPFDNQPPAIAPINKKSKVHECSICHRVFASGQALGGHKRCHWITSNSPDPSLTAKLRPMPDNAGHHQLRLGPIFDPSDPLDLNLPAPASDLALVRDINSPLRLEVPAAAAAAMYPWIDLSNNKNSSNNNEGSNANNVEDEAESKIKLAKLSDLKDMKEGGPWLQVGIGSSTNEGGDP